MSVAMPPVSKADERAMALAGVLQACHSVTGLARSGLIGQDSLAGSLQSILVLNPESTFDVYPEGNGIRTGLRLIMEILGDLQLSEHADTLRYATAVINLEKKVRSDSVVMGKLGDGIAGINEHLESHSLAVAEPDMVDRLSRLYEQTAGTIHPRIRVLGQQKYLNNSSNTSRIRALLLAALRSAVLWRQLGGSQSQFILGRGKLLRSAERCAEIIN